MAAYDDLDNKRIFAISIGSIVVVAVSALAVNVLYYWMVRMVEDDTAAMSTYDRQNRILVRQTEEIENFGVDSEGRIQVPIEQAIRAVVDDQQTDPEPSDSDPAET